MIHFPFLFFLLKAMQLENLLHHHHHSSTLFRSIFRITLCSPPASCSCHHYHHHRVFYHNLFSFLHFSTLFSQILFFITFSSLFLFFHQKINIIQLCPSFYPINSHINSSTSENSPGFLSLSSSQFSPQKPENSRIHSVSFFSPTTLSK